MNKFALIPEEMLSLLKEKSRHNEHIDTKGTVSNTVHNLDNELEKLLSRTDIPPDEKSKMYNQLLKRYLIFREKQNKKREAPVQVKLMKETPDFEYSIKNETTDVANKEKMKDKKQDQEENEEEKYDPILMDIFENTSSSKKPKMERLLKYLKSEKSIIKWNDNGEVSIEGKKIPGSHLADLVSDLFQPRKGFDPIGWKFFDQALSKMNVPKTLFSNTQRRNFMQTEYKFPSELDGNSSTSAKTTPVQVTKKRKTRLSSSTWSPYPSKIKALTRKYNT